MKGYWISLYKKVENQENLKKYVAKKTIGNLISKNNDL